MNIQSLISNHEYLEILMLERKPMIVLLSETHVTSDISNSEIEISGYTLVCCNSHSRHTGGVAMYIKNELKLNKLSNETFYNSIWILSIEVICEQNVNSGIFTVIYRSPSSPITQFINVFEQWTIDHIDMSKTNIICGDFNVDLLKSIYAPNMKKSIRELGFKQIIRTPTRISSTTKTLIDYVLVNVNKITAVTLPSDQISDHLTIMISKEEL